MIYDSFVRYCIEGIFIARKIVKSVLDTDKQWDQPQQQTKIQLLNENEWLSVYKRIKQCTEFRVTLRSI